jgi:hypothetical protein
MRTLSHGRPRLATLTLFAAVLLSGGFLASAPKTANATPAYARRYGVECTTCHSPFPPRLNNVGMVYRRAGFRLPDADDNGKLMLKTVAAHTIGEAAAVAGQIDWTMLQKQDAAAEGVSQSTAQLSEVEIIAGTAAGEHYSAQILYPIYDDEAGSHVENFEAQGNWGRPDNQVIVRAGLAQTMLWQKGGHGATTLSAPLVLDEAAPSAIGGFAGPGLGTMLPLVEVGWMGSKLNAGKLTSTMASVALTNGYMADGSGARTHSGDGTDVMAQATQLFGSRNTANVFYYKGHTRYDIGEETFHTDLFNRYGVTGNYQLIDPIDVTAGFVGGQDESSELGATIKTTGYYAELTGAVSPRWIATYRYDAVDPNTDVSEDTIKGNTLSTSFLLDEAVFLQAEYRELQAGGAKSHQIVGRIRFVY